jgi:hypothetical protein
MISLLPSEVAPTVGRLQSGSEQSHPARFAIWSFVFGVKLSLLPFLAIDAGCSELPPGGRLR